MSGASGSPSGQSSMDAKRVCLQLRERFRQDLPVLRLHSDIGGEFSSDLLRDFCRGEGILQSFMRLDSHQQNGIAECRIGVVMEVARTSMIHAAAPHFLWSFAVQYAVHQLNLWPRASLPETSPTLHWRGEVGNASVFRVCGSRAFVRDTSKDKLSTHAIPCGPAPSGVSQVDPLLGTTPVEVAVGSGAARGAASEGAEPGVAESEGAGSRGAEPGGEEPGGAEPAGVELGGAEPEGVEPGGAESEGTKSGDCLRSSCVSDLFGVHAFGVELPELEPLEALEPKRPPNSPADFKARYVARGFSQRQGVDYFQTFSPTPKMTTLRVLLHVAAQRDYELHSLNFSTAFLQGSLPRRSGCAAHLASLGHFLHIPSGASAGQYTPRCPAAQSACPAALPEHRPARARSACSCAALPASALCTRTLLPIRALPARTLPALPERCAHPRAACTHFVGPIRALFPPARCPDPQTHCPPAACALPARTPRAPSLLPARPHCCALLLLSLLQLLLLHALLLLLSVLLPLLHALLLLLSALLLLLSALLPLMHALLLLLSSVLPCLAATSTALLPPLLPATATAATSRCHYCPACMRCSAMPYPAWPPPALPCCRHLG
ncbi:unnamed protein product, partial [Closterium sp. NIES-54]